MILDIIIVAIILLSVLLGCQKGFAKTAVNLLALIISIAVTAVLYNPIANFIINVTNIDETIESTIYDKTLNAPSEEENQLINIQSLDSTTLTVTEISTSVVKLGVFIILLIGTKILIRCISTLAEFISNLPIVKHFNKLGGGIYGLLRGLVIIYIALLIIQIATKANPTNTAYQQIEQTTLTKMMYENNVINIFFK